MYKIIYDKIKNIIHILLYLWIYIWILSHMQNLTSTETSNVQRLKWLNKKKHVYEIVSVLIKIKIKLKLILQTTSV